MDRIKTKLIIDVTRKLGAIPDSDAKVDLIDEVCENLYQRYLGFVAEGMSEADAYARALEELGDVEELRHILDEASPSGSWQSDLGQGIDELVRSAMGVAREAVSQSKEFIKEAAAKIKEKYPDGFHGAVHIHVDDDKNGVWAEQDGSEVFTGAELSAQGLRGVSIQTGSDDVVVKMVDQELDHIVISGDTDNLRYRRTEDGVLHLAKQRRSGLFGGDALTVVLPRQLWATLRVTSGSGDIRLDGAFDVEQITLRTGSGDIWLQGNVGAVSAESGSGDVWLAGEFAAVQSRSASGDIELQGAVGGPVHLKTSSGDISAELPVLPERVMLINVSGDCRLAVPGETGFNFSYHTTCGDLHSHFPLEGEKGNKTYLGGGTAQLSASTISGDVLLERL